MSLNCDLSGVCGCLCNASGKKTYTQVLAGLELLLRRSMDWEEYAHKKISLEGVLVVFFLGVLVLRCWWWEGGGGGIWLTFCFCLDAACCHAFAKFLSIRWFVAPV